MHTTSPNVPPLDRRLTDDDDDGLFLPSFANFGINTTLAANATSCELYHRPKHAENLIYAPEKVWRMKVRDVSRSTGSRRALCFLELANTWDRGSAYVRQKILEDFVASSRWKSGLELEKELGNGGSLLLTRFTAWFRLTYLKAKNLATQLQAISIFVSASSGHRFLAEFIEVGGVLTVLETLNMPKAREADKTEALKLLLHVCNAGRKYKEFICECYGIRAVTDCLARSKSNITHNYAGILLQAVGSDNQRFQQHVYKALMATLTSDSVSDTNSQKVAGEVVRKILPSIVSIHPSVVDATIGLLKSPHTPIQYEGCELLKDLVKRVGLQDLILSRLIELLRIRPPEAEQQTIGALTGKAQQSRMRISMHTMHAAKLLGHMAATSPQLAKRMISQQCIHALLIAIGDVDNPESQRYATNTLVFLAEKFPDVARALQKHMGTNFYHVFETKPDTFFKDLTQDQIRYLQQNTVFMRIVEGREDKLFESDLAPDEGAMHPGGEEADGKDDAQAGKGETDEVLQRFLDAKAGKSNIPVEEQESVSATTVADLYKPIAVNAATRSMAGNTFQRLMKRNKELELETELEEMKQCIHRSSVVQTAATAPATASQSARGPAQVMPGLFSSSRKRRFEPRLDPKLSTRYNKAVQRKEFAVNRPPGSAFVEDVEATFEGAGEEEDVDENNSDEEQS